MVFISRVYPPHIWKSECATSGWTLSGKKLILAQDPGIRGSANRHEFRVNPETGLRRFREAGATKIAIVAETI